jgi:hypothetical protein
MHCPATNFQRIPSGDGTVFMQLVYPASYLHVSPHETPASSELPLSNNAMQICKYFVLDWKSSTEVLFWWPLEKVSLHCKLSSPPEAHFIL